MEIGENSEKGIIEEYLHLSHEARLVNEVERPRGENVEHISTLISKADVLFNEVPNVSTALGLLDAEFISTCSTVVRRTAESVDANLLSFDADECADRLMLYIKKKAAVSRSNRLPWHILAPFAAKRAFCCMPFNMPMLGTLQVGEVAVPQRKAQKRREKEEEGYRMQPECVKSLEKQEEGVKESLHYIMSVLTAAYRANRNKPICCFRLLVDPESFAATIENIFHFSFLVKDGFVSLSLGENGIPVVAPVTRDCVEAQNKCNKEKQQMIIVMNMEQWEKCLELFNITQAMLKRSITATNTPRLRQ